MDKNLKKKWLSHAVGGILFMGLGLSILGESSIMKGSETGFYQWFGFGTLGLTVFFAGLSVFGQAIVFKSEIDRQKKKQ